MLRNFLQENNWRINTVVPFDSSVLECASGKYKYETTVKAGAGIGKATNYLLSKICEVIFAVEATDSCHLENGKLTVYVAQNFALGANVLSISLPCR